VDESTAAKFTHRYQVIPERELVLASFSGLVTPLSLFRGIRAFWKDATYNKEYHGILDLTETEWAIKADRVPELGRILVAHSDYSTGSWAVKVNSPLSTALSLFFQKSALKKHRLAIFSTWNSTLEWMPTKIPRSVVDQFFELKKD
jgi:hypothetical protein